MKTALWAAAAILILSGAAVYAKDAPSADKAPDDGYIFPINSKSAASLYERKEQRLKAAEAKRAGEEAKQREQEKKAKVDKIQAKTGRTATSWQVLNR